ncbi:MAG TPA: mandelate racemase/muconate lactonizing enzyme family protein [Chloroflexota bacterium]|nr:mandelate racemase/muconate lactonizing enzyme family protein [Chloroflexota bacterium]
MPKIVDVRAVALAIPLDRPTRISTRTVTAREFVLVWVDGDDGVSGIGYTYAGTVGGRLVRDAVLQCLRPLLVGEAPELIERHWATMYQDSLLIGRRGALLRAISAVDIALWDRLAVVAGLPLYRLLGAYRDSVPCYASGGYYRDEDPVRAITAEMERYVAMGFRDVKMKVGAALEVDVARVRAAREVIGATGRLALDANNAYRSVPEAMRAARAFEPFDPWWFEEPLSPDDIAGHAALARQLEVPIATGEIHQTRWEFRDLIERQGADILQPDAGVLGGVSEWLKVARAAQVFDIPVAPHWHADLHVHLAAAVPSCLTVEWFRLEEDIYNFGRLLAEQLQPRDGTIALPARQGLGLVLDEDAVARFTLQGS